MEKERRINIYIIIMCKFDSCWILHQNVAKCIYIYIAFAIESMYFKYIGINPVKNCHTRNIIKIDYRRPK